MDEPSLGRSRPLVPPLYQSSVYVLPDLDALDAIMDEGAPGFVYARDAHPNAQLLAERLAQLEGTDWALVGSSGMAAISAALLALVQQGDRIVASNRLYGRTTQLLARELHRFGVETTFVDPCDLNEVRSALQRPAKVLLVETISNPLLRLADVETLARWTKANDTWLCVDNTFATPVLFRPAEWGADLTIESLTKMLAGHSDVTLGAVAGTGDLLGTQRQTMSIWGLSANPFDCWLALRGLETLALRVRTASERALALAHWLTRQPNVVRVIYPGLVDHPDHALASRLLAGAFGNMLCFEVAGGRDGVNRFLRQAVGIPFSPSLGHTTTTCSHPASTSHRYVSQAEKRRQGISDGLIRLSVGVEELADIQREISRGLA
ncbi:MAG: aminotransferase class I/II-fold pyridoxal phosphate-dependent enzyme [Gemmataceae bacterium]|nr:aminotransferase class I/II-fold pyridoxal phosphate-dependent enzyme [Gemmataceae bacterium]MDW8264207.1 aminotransferase class I/II-fold pyridoxal phosphate-dependent enzyme [Gemmataceae bacterium]